MFKVECPGCKAPYQVDERRIPGSGLKMRCPKCGTSFKVDPPADGRRTGPIAVLGGALGLDSDSESMPPPALSAPAARPPVDLRGTMLASHRVACPRRLDRPCRPISRARCWASRPPLPAPLPMLRRGLRKISKARCWASRLPRRPRLRHPPPARLHWVSRRRCRRAARQK